MTKREVLFPTGVGLGMRSAFAAGLARGEARDRIAFIEVAPENHIHRGGRWPALLEQAMAFHPVITHGLTLSLGGEAELDADYLAGVAELCERVASPWHSDHLCFAADGDARLHDLLPLPFTRRGAKRVAERVKRAQAATGREMLVENISQYLRMGAAEMEEVDFVREVVESADCGLLLDVNNIYVNAQNFGFDPYEWLARAPLHRVRQLHVAGHEAWAPYEMFVDTHGAQVLDPVIEMMAWVVERTGPLPVLLERDTNIPPLAELLDEVERLQTRYERALQAGGHV